eukprot:5288322-Pyramimonas_sp.AAC.1
MVGAFAGIGDLSRASAGGHSDLQCRGDHHVELRQPAVPTVVQDAGARDLRDSRSPACRPLQLHQGR